MSLKKILAGTLSAGMMLSFIPATAMAANKGWVEQDGYWYYYVSDTECLKDTWQEIDGHWYFFLEDGGMVSDHWVFIDGKLYHFDKRGHMEKNKWIECEGWSDYVYDDDGTAHEVIRTEWRFVGSDGAAYSGWKKIGGSWYYFDTTNSGPDSDSLFGVMYQGLRTVGDDIYFFGSDGKMKSNCWIKDSDEYWYYFGSDGKALKGWQQIKGKWYYFDEYSEGQAATGATIDWSSDEPACWMFEDSGALTSKTGWVLSTDESFEGSSQAWYYVKSGGKCCRNEWYKINGKWYYFDNYGKAVMNKTSYLINDKVYDFASSGACKNPDSGRKVTGWTQVCDKWSDGMVWVYGDKSGKLYKEQWLTYGGAKYYFEYDGRMVCNQSSYIIDGRIYSFDKEGKAKDLSGNTKGWLEIGEFKAYIGSDGKAYTGWQQIGGKWYYFTERSGLAATGWWHLEEGEFLFKENGEMVTGWYNYYGSWLYADSSGRLYKDRWLNYRGSWYYFASWASMVASDYGSYLVKGYGYYFDDDGKCINPDKPSYMVIW